MNKDYLLRFSSELTVEQLKHLNNQISSIDFDLLKKLYNSEEEVISSECESVKSYETNEDCYSAGLETFKNSEYAVVTMAGGQGTRLGFNGPKGTYILESVDKSLFEIQCDKLKHIYELSNSYPYWYIMTSNQNNLDTINFFNKNNYFNYPKDKIKFFIQEELPMLDQSGNIVMDSKYNIKMGANGSGGVFHGLDKSGIITEMINNGIKWIFIGGIDNVLLPIDNPDLIGFSIINNYKVASKIIRKGYPEEKVGVFCKKNGKVSVIEYIEMTDSMNHMVDSSGELVYGDAHILCNLFNIDVLKSILDKPLPYRKAVKKTECIDNNGNINEIKGYKFECFVFDAFLYVSDVGLLRAKREDCFAPIKNKEGIDSPETALELYKKFNNVKYK